MIAAEVRINGQLIGNVYAHNQYPLYDDKERPTDLYQYYYCVQTIPDKDGEKTKSGHVVHQRSDGWEKLFSIILNDACGG